jgi:mono/diheme cytochrome c family protein
VRGQRIPAASTLIPASFCLLTLSWSLAGLWILARPAAAEPAAARVTAAQTAAGDPEPGAELLRSTVRRHCLVCHNDRTLTAGLSLQDVDTSRVAEHAPVLERVFQKLRAGEMPPAGRPRPDAAVTAGLVAWLETALDAEAAANPDPGAPAIHRLNRAEYRNAVRDLLGLDLDHARDLPADDSGYGFDNIGDVLTVSPLHVEQYVAAARRVSRLAVGSLTPRPVVERYEPPDGTTDEEIDGLPPNERGGILFRHYFAFDADYAFTVRVRGRRTAGMPAPRLDVRVDGRRVRLIDADFDPEEANQLTRNFVLRLPIPAGEHEIGAGFLTEYAQSEDGGETNDYSVDYVLVEGPYDAAGPGETEVRRRLFVCRPAAAEPEEPCARRILTRLARRAYRRPVTEADLDPLIDLFATGRADGTRFEDGIEMALSGVLVSPSFLFRAPRAPAGADVDSAYPLSDIDLASRLSFFLWSSIPDDELLDLAERGRLGDPAVLAGQIARMLADPKAGALVENFGGQWLHLRNVAGWTPDPVRFADFDDSLRYAFERETTLFLDHVIREDRSVLELIDADYTFLNERLAGFYGIDGISGGYFRRVPLEGTARGGILTHGSVLMVTSYPTRTSPVLRGKWVLENLLGAPPPPPPPDVPALEADADASAGSLREALERHRANPACAACHAKLDPLGFALENFDAVGAYRTEDDGIAVEASGALPDGTLVDGPAGLRRVLRGRRDEFVETLAAKLLTYAIGRGLESYDQPAVRDIRRRVEAADYRFSALVSAIVDSVPFRLRRIPEP